MSSLNRISGLFPEPDEPAEPPMTGEEVTEAMNRALHDALHRREQRSLRIARRLGLVPADGK